VPVTTTGTTTTTERERERERASFDSIPSDVARATLFDASTIER